MSVELRHLRYVVYAADQKSFRRAALALGVRESAVSRRIRDLEDELGAALFIRHSGGVVLTQAGERFVRNARQALTKISDAALDVGTIGRGENGTIRIGIFSSLASGFLTQLLFAFGDSHNDIHVEIVENALNENIVAVQQHQMDVAFVAGLQPFEGCDIEQLWTEQIYVVVPKAHKLSRKKSIRTRDLGEERFVISESDPGPEFQKFLLKHLAVLGVQPKIERHAVGRDTLMQLVSLGRGLTLTSKSTIATRFPGVVYRQLEGEVFHFYAVWSPRNDNPAFRRFLSLARQISKQDAKDASIAAAMKPASATSGGLLR